MRTDLAHSKKHEIVHEAGHAVIFWYFGFALNKVTVHPEPEFGSVAGYCKALFPDSGNTTALPQNPLTAGHVFALAAGRIATEIHFPDIPSGNSHSYDFAVIEKMVAPDPETLAMQRWRVDNPNGTMEQFYQEFKKPVIKILKTKPAHRAMSALSKALSKAVTLSGAEAAAIIFKAWGDPPPLSALPVEKHMALIDKGPQCFTDLRRAIQAYLSVIEADIKRLRDAGSDEENEKLDRIWGKILLLKVLV